MNSLIPKDFEEINKNQLKINDFEVSGEPIKFKSRSPIFKALMKLEFEKAIREHVK